jgi:hypothetical protein
MSKLQEKPSSLKREHPVLQKLKFINFFLCIWVIFDLLDSDPDSEFGSRDLLQSGSNPDTVPDQILIRIWIKSGYGSGSTTLIS